MKIMDETELMKTIVVNQRSYDVPEDVFKLLERVEAVLLFSHPEHCHHGSLKCDCEHAKAWRAVRKAIKALLPKSRP